jgi:ribonuclease HI
MTNETLLAHCDGGARGNPGPAAAACVIDDRAEKKRFLCGKYLGKTTNNQAEYAAVKLALGVIKGNYQTKRDVKLFLDSTLVVNQLNGLYKVKDPTLRQIVFEIREIESHLGEIYYQHVKREENTEADDLVNRAINLRSDFQQTLKTEK